MIPEDPHNRTLILLRPDLDDLPPVSLPTGVTIRPNKTGDEETWGRIWRQSEPFDPIVDKTFRESFGTDETLLSERIYFAVNERTGENIGTVTAWTEETPSRNHAGLDGWGRVHWLATLPAYQGRGIGKALFLYCLHRLRDFGHRESFLVTSSGRTAAVALYNKYGFHEATGGTE
ncbi:MAG: GNAT family N-acetyltransferase [Fibrella sp.]|nr:GNAT family N-acetyltransferase [Armatimonadota bacterium]